MYKILLNVGEVKDNKNMVAVSHWPTRQS